MAAAGLVAVVTACCTSGFAGVYFEKILKGAKVSVWMRNIQLGLFSVALGLGGCIYNDYGRISAPSDEGGGFFQNYTMVTWFVITLQGQYTIHTAHPHTRTPHTRTPAHPHTRSRCCSILLRSVSNCSVLAAMRPRATFKGPLALKPAPPSTSKAGHFVTRLAATH